MNENMIHDQASGLRRLTKPSITKVIAVTGGKGGVGKSNVTSGMAI
ncbi:MinD/ParA family protein, partial [Vibrio lentus]|nr:MinD/ParA family protein [Vibrio lentus]